MAHAYDVCGNKEPQQKTVKDSSTPFKDSLAPLTDS